MFIAYREVARPLGSEGRVERRQAQVALMEQGSVRRLTTYTDIDEARAAADQLAESRG